MFAPRSGERRAFEIDRGRGFSMYSARRDDRAVVRPAAPLAIAIVGALLVAGCGGGGGVSGLNPFGGGFGDVDAVFLAAAGTWDLNKDGVVTCDEWKAYAAELFDAADANKDGMLTPDEYQTIIRTDRMFETVDFKWWDANGDGKITRAEMVDRPNPAFVLLDKEKKCQLTSTELSAGRYALQTKKPIIGPPPDDNTKKLGR